MIEILPAHLQKLNNLKNHRVLRKSKQLLTLKTNIIVNTFLHTFLHEKCLLSL